MGPLVLQGEQEMRDGVVGERSNMLRDREEGVSLLDSRHRLEQRRLRNGKRIQREGAAEEFIPQSIHDFLSGTIFFFNIPVLDDLFLTAAMAKAGSDSGNTLKPG